MTTRSLLFRLALLIFACLPLAGAAQDTSVDAAATQTLIDTLEDPEARQRLIDALSAEVAQTAPQGEEVVEETLAAQAAEYTQTLLSDIATRTVRVYQDFARFALLPDLLTPERRATIQAEFWPLLFTILATVAVYRSLRIFSRRLRMSSLWDDMGFGAQLRVFFNQIFLRFVSVFTAAGFGIALATFFGEGTPLLSISLYTNAFVIFGMFSLVLGMFVSRDPRDLTFAALPKPVERVIFTSLRRTMGFLIFGIVAAVPISQIWVNFVLARSLRTAILTLGAIAALWSIWRIARTLKAARDAAIADGDPSDAQEDDAGRPRRGMTLWERIWPSLAVAYVLVSYALALANPNDMIALVGRATLFSTLALVSVIVATRAFTVMSQDGIRVPLPEGLNETLPPLEARLNGLMPAILLVVGVALLGAAAALFLEGWNLAPVAEWLTGSGNAFIWNLASVAIVAVGLVLAWSVLTAWIDTRLSEDLTGRHVSARSRTLLALFKNVLTIVLIVFGGMTILSELGLDISPLLAGAGVVGLAIGFGAQKLVQDIITGVFIQLENAINEGDVITVAGVTGSVEKLTIRSVGLRDLAGVYHLIPFSAVDTVSNFMRRFAYHVEVAGVGYGTDLDAAKDAMHRAFDTVKAGEYGPDITDDLEWHGVVGLGDSSVNLRARIKTKPGMQWAIGRAYTAEIKREFDAAGIEIPFPHRELKLPQEMIEALRAKPLPRPDDG